MNGYNNLNENGEGYEVIKRVIADSYVKHKIIESIENLILHGTPHPAGKTPIGIFGSNDDKNNRRILNNE